jgi:hypothetical protein
MTAKAPLAARPHVALKPAFAVNRWPSAHGPNRDRRHGPLSDGAKHAPPGLSVGVKAEDLFALDKAAPARTNTSVGGRSPLGSDSTLQ